MPTHERLLTEDILDYSHTTRALTESKWFIVQKKDGTKIGLMNHRLTLPARWIEISYGLTPNERRKEYGTEAVQLMVDYLFLSKDIARIQALIARAQENGYEISGNILLCYGNGSTLKRRRLHDVGIFKIWRHRHEPTIFKDPLNEKLEREESELLVSMPASILLLRPVGEALFYRGT